MKRPLSTLFGLLALALIFGLAQAPDAEPHGASVVAAGTEVADVHGDHRHSELPGDSCVTSASQSCMPLIAQARSWTFTPVPPEEMASLPGSDQHTSSAPPKPDTPPPRA